MTSSMLTGERRWASARRGGMTVLGKVAVPKPINLPSQRLENHGQNPNVEIVPKGTHSWGGRSSSSTSNAWGTSAVSPNTDGSTSSPSHLSGRPSSGGSGTRPSTAGSDRAHEQLANAWGSNSRPSSASGSLTSNQTPLTSLRPRSAETRPGSSQLSRFAEPLPDNSVAWSGNGLVEKLGVASSKNDSFSLTSGDFPTLGAEKETSGKSAESQDYGSHGRPGSSSGIITTKERSGSIGGDVSINSNVKIGPANSWRRENPPYIEDGARNNVEKWHADPQLYPNSGIPMQHYDAWHGPPVNNHAGGVWYRGPPGGPPFGSPVPPSGFPMEPFPYYRPQLPPGALANPQLPPPGNGPRGSHPKNGDIYRPHMHDAYIRPGMALRPGFYPGPVPYEGYYGPPPMGYCQSNERDMPFMGMAVGPAPYNRYPGQNAPDQGNSHSRSSGYGPGSNTLVSEQLESGHPQDSRGPYKVILKQHDSWEGKDEELDETMTTDASYSGNGDHPMKSSWENGWRADHRKDGEMGRRRMMPREEASFDYEAVDNRGGVPLKPKSPESVENLKAFDESSVGKSQLPEHAASAFSEVSVGQKDSSLIQKIEGLNAKARGSDVRQDVKFVSSREEQKNKLQVANYKANHFSNESGTGSVSVERTFVSGISIDSPDDQISAGNKNLVTTVASGAAASRRSTHGMHSRSDHHGKGRFNAQEADGWRKKFEIPDSPSVHSENASVVHGQDYTSADATEKSMSYPHGKEVGESIPPASDELPRAKMKELAKQRLKQREKEEEERTRDQMAKALAKLEELNKRTQAGEASQKSETVSVSGTQNKQEQFSTPVKSAVLTSKSNFPSLATGFNPNVAHSESNVVRAEKSTISSSEVLQEPLKAGQSESVFVNEQLELQQEDINADGGRHSTSPQIYNSTSKQKRGSYRQKQNGPSERNLSDKLIPSATTEASKGRSDGAGDGNVSLDSVALTRESSLSVNPSTPDESSVHHKRKNRTGKNKQRLEEPSPSMVSKDTTASDDVTESVDSKTSNSVLDPGSVQHLTDSKDANQSTEQQSALAIEEVHNRVHNQWKSQHSRKVLRNPQSNKSVEKFYNSITDAVVWAPVRSQNKTEVSEEASPRTAVETVGPSIKSDQQAQNNPRNKRAEMERYIPKPVAKEMAQQGGGNQSVVPSISQMTSDETVGKPESGYLVTENSQSSFTAVRKVGSVMESRSGDGRHNKSAKMHGSWRQRGSAESTSSFSTNPSRNTQKSIEHHQRQKPNESSVKEQLRYSDEWNASDGRNVPDNSDASIAVPVAKDHGMTARGKRQAYRGHKSTGYDNDLDEKRTNSGEAEKVCAQSSAPEVNRSDLPAISKENNVVGERSTTHWQPKSHSASSNGQPGSKSNGRQMVGAEVGRGTKRDSTHDVRVQSPARHDKETGLVKPQHDKETGVVKPQPQHDHFLSDMSKEIGVVKPQPQPQHDHSLSDKSNLEEAPSFGRQEVRRERKTGLHRGYPSSPLEQSSSMDSQQEQHTSSGFRKNGNQNSRFGREHESRGDWGVSGKDNRQQSIPTNREKQRHNSHYEYLPVGSHSNSKSDNFEPPKDGSNNSGSRFRERGQSHMRRGGGNFYGRQSGHV